jgi:uncharacterized protein (TIGR02001 family)
MATSLPNHSLAIACAAGLAVFGSAKAVAQEVPAAEADAGKIDVSVSVMSDYRFRGWSLSGEDPAVQLDASATHESGFYAGVFASSIEAYGGDEEGTGATVELDYYGGWSGELSGWQVDVGAQLYTYPGAAADVDYFVLPLSVTRSLGEVDLTAGFEHAPAQRALGDETSNYTWLEAAWTPLDWGVAFRSSIGLEDGAMAPGGKTDWLVSASLPAGMLEFAFTYIDSDVAEAGSALVAEARASF